MLGIYATLLSQKPLIEDLLLYNNIIVTGKLL